MMNAQEILVNLILSVLLTIWGYITLARRYTRINLGLSPPPNSPLFIEISGDAASLLSIFLFVSALVVFLPLLLTLLGVVVASDSLFWLQVGAGLVVILGLIFSLSIQSALSLGQSIREVKQRREKEKDE